MAQNLLLPMDADDEVGLADWIEATMLLEKKHYVPRARIRRYLRSLFGEDQPDVAVDVLLKEIGRRQRVCGSGYPYIEDGTGVRLSAAYPSSPYLFMLCISTSKSYRDQHRYADTDELFDELVLDALQRYVGAGSEGIRFAAPASGGRPKNFQDGIRWLAGKIGVPKGTGRARRHSGDGGLDVIVWRPFRDMRDGFLVILAQCTVQLDWAGKAKDITEDVWRGWIDFGKDPHLVLAIPHVVPSGFEKWDELRRLVHTVVDRLRIAELLGTATPRRDAEMKRWIASEVIEMGA